MLKNSNNQHQQYLRGNQARTCSFCKKREPWNAQANQKLKRCSRCRARLYCSRACQRSDWKSGHQRACAAASAAGSNNTPKSKEQKRTEPERKREHENKTENSCLQGLSEEEAMNRLIDAYRLRVEDERIYRGYLRGRYATDNHDNNTHTNIDNIDMDPSLQSALGDFQDFLDLAESSAPASYSSSSSASPPSSSSSPSSMSISSSAPSSYSSFSENKPQADEAETDTEKKTNSILPSWWNAQKRAHCEWRALQSEFWSSLCTPVNKDAIVERYRDSMMPMKLRVLAEAVYGYNVMDQPR